MLELWHLRHARRKIVAKADRETSAAAKAGDQARVLALTADCYLDCQRVDDRVSRLQDQTLRQEAQELDVPFPSTDDRPLWRPDGEGGVLLTFEGRATLRKLIDAERARRFEVKTLWVTKFWLPLLAALVGVIGALTGLMAVIRHTK